MKRALFILTILSFVALAAVIALGQPAAKQFEIASIKPSEPAAPNTKRSSLTFGAGESLTATYTTPRSLITVAYNVRDLQISGAPGWIGTERYDIEARTAPGEIAAGPTEAADDRTRERLRSLLAERFGLVVHHETREQTVYLLTVAKNGPKLKEAATSADRHATSGGRGRSQGFAAKVEWLAGILSNVTGRPVLDKTGLTGYYDWVLEWTPDTALSQQGSPPAENSAPTIFTALQEQLGLRLETGKGPVDLVVIDQVNRPSAN
jgi:uncharacterized protein (TIGR03435 family)